MIQGASWKRYEKDYKNQKSFKIIEALDRYQYDIYMFNELHRWVQQWVFVVSLLRITNSVCCLGAPLGPCWLTTQLDVTY